MENDTEVIRQQMTETRASLSDKLEALEDQVLATVQDTRETVTETVEEVKEAVENTVETVTDTVQQSVAAVKETLDIRRHVENYPWAMVAGAVAVGYIGSTLLMPRSTSSSEDESSSTTNHVSAPVFASDSGSTRKEGNSWLSNLMQTLGPSLEKLKRLAIGTTTGVVSDLVLNAAPESLRQNFGEVFDQITTSLGGQPIHGPAKKPAPEHTGPGGHPENQPTPRF